MRLEFNWPGGGSIYDENWGGTVPRAGDDLHFDGDVRVPDGSYTVKRVVWFFTDDGIDQVRVVLGR